MLMLVYTILGYYNHDYTGILYYTRYHTICYWITSWDPGVYYHSQGESTSSSPQGAAFDGAPRRLGRQVAALGEVTMNEMEASRWVFCYGLIRHPEAIHWTKIMIKIGFYIRFPQM